MQQLYFIETYKTESAKYKQKNKMHTTVFVIESHFTDVTIC